MNAKALPVVKRASVHRWLSAAHIQFSLAP